MKDLTQFPIPTFGGGPNWEEIGAVGEFRIQRNRVTGQHRLLDGANVRRAWGTLEVCEEALERLIDQPNEPSNINLPVRTLGGMQFWADELVTCGWRIQRSVFTGHCRLLDASNRRQAWGTFEQCEVAMMRLHEAAGIEPVSDRLVVLVHGILGWKDRWSVMSTTLRRHGYETVDVNYPSSRAKIEDHVRQLDTVVENLSEHCELHFVTHSMGGLLVRRLLAENPDIPADRVVMIAPPSQGAMTADIVRDFFAFRLVFGPAGQQLVTGVNSFVSDLPEPPCEFGVIAGGRGDGKGFNPIIIGDDDGVVEVERTKLDGMSDFMLFNATHNGLLTKQEVADAAARFLENGSFGGPRDH